MEFHEYPKALYLRGELRTVAGADDEAQARSDGFMGWAEDAARDDAPSDAPDPEPPVHVDPETPRAKRAYTRRAKPEAT